MRHQDSPETVHAPGVPGQPRAPDGDAERPVDQRRIVDCGVHGVFDQHGEQPGQGGILAQGMLAERVADRPVQVSHERRTAQAHRPQVVQRGARTAYRKPHARPAGPPERVSQPVEQSPQAAVPVGVAEHASPLHVPRGRVAVQHELAIGQEGPVSRQVPCVQRPDADIVQQLRAYPARHEVDQRGRADIEGEAPLAVIPGAPAGVTVRLKHNGGYAGGLQPQRCRHAGHPAADHRHVDLAVLCLNICSEHMFRMESPTLPCQYLSAGSRRPAITLDRVA